MEQTELVAMNLPVSSHVDRLAELVSNMQMETIDLQKQLQVLRGNIIQLSYVNKESDKELNQFLVESISSLRNRTQTEWEKSQKELQQAKKQLFVLCDQHTDIQIQRQAVTQRTETLQDKVGLI